MNAVGKLKEIFLKNKEKRICVLGTSCIGKTTLLKSLPDCLDMDKLVFPLLTDAEKEYVCGDPWTQEIGDKMDELVKSKIKIEKGKPVFGTVLIDCDLIVYLDADVLTLTERAKKRGANLENVLNMKKDIEQDLQKTNVSVITVVIK